MSTTFKIDHIVIMVDDLDQAMKDYAGFGFTVLSGGTHADNPTYNALIVFRDGVYIEIIALQPGKKAAPKSPRLEKWDAASPGLVDFALLPTKIEADILAARERGLDIEDAQDGGRIRPDGQAIKWQTANLGGSGLPFLCGDVTARSLRVPEGEARQHPNGVIGVADVTIAVRSLSSSVEKYEALLGTPPQPIADDETLQATMTVFSLTGTTLTLAEPLNENSPLQTYLSKGERPYRFSLKSTQIQVTKNLPLPQTHQAHIRLVPA